VRLKKPRYWIFNAGTTEQKRAIHKYIRSHIRAPFVKATIQPDLGTYKLAYILIKISTAPSSPLPRSTAPNTLKHTHYSGHEATFGLHRNGFLEQTRAGGMFRTEMRPTKVKNLEEAVTKINRYTLRRSEDYHAEQRRGTRRE